MVGCIRYLSACSDVCVYFGFRQFDMVVRLVSGILCRASHWLSFRRYGSCGWILVDVRLRPVHWRRRQLGYVRLCMGRFASDGLRVSQCETESLT